MTTSRLSEFRGICLNIFGEILNDHGYRLRGSYTRPLGIALEFAGGGRHLFVVNEGSVLYIDLIISESANKFWRVSLNQALWFLGVRSVSSPATIEEKLTLFASEIVRSCRGLLSGDLSLLDSRYCFSLSEVELSDYFMFQRGCNDPK